MSNKTLSYIVAFGALGVAAFFIYNQIMNSKAIKKIQSVTDRANVSGTLQAETSRGALNNPGNIRKSSVTYDGEISSPSTEFKSFSSLAYGYRAMFQLLRSYVKRNYNTLDKIINRYAPAADKNPVDNYIDFITDATGIDRHADLTALVYTPDVQKVVAAMTIFEQGNDFEISPLAIRTGFDMVS